MSDPLPPEPTAAPPGELPVPPGPLIGRADEQRAAETLLRRADVRLLTISGASGVGKTRLALEVAGVVQANFPDCITFLSLGAFRDPALVAPALAQALGIKETTTPQGHPPLTGLLLTYLRDKAALLVLDNFEHVLPAAPLVAELLAGCPRLKVLITSRTVLHLRGEHDLALAPLALPDLARLPPPTALAGVPAVALFLARAAAVKPGFVLTAENAATVAAICHRLDGLPLAIELAAAWVKILSPAALLARLEHPLALLTGGPRDLPARQQTLRNALDWSYDLLDPAEQRLFRRLAVFVGGATLAAVETVCDRGQGPGAGGQGSEPETSVLSPQSSVLALLAALVDKSLLHAETRGEGEPRFHMLETIREYALEHLAASGEAPALRQAHAQYFLAQAEAAESHLTGAERGVWLARLETEHDNLRAALAWSQDEAPPADPTGLRLRWALSWFWYFRGYLSEGRAWLEGSLARGEPPTYPEEWARVLGTAGVLAYLQNDYATARAHLEASAAHWRALDQPRNLGFALTFLGQVLARQNDPAARAVSEESVACFRAVGDTWGLAMALDFHGEVARLAGGDAECVALHSESLALFRQLNDRWGIALALSNLGRVTARLGDYAAARAQLEEALAIQQALGDQWNTAWTLRTLGEVLRAQGETASATPLLEESRAILAALGHTAESADPPRSLSAAPERPAPLPADPTRLTAREVEVLRLVAQGLTDSQVAAQLVLSPRTVQSHLSTIYSKLGVATRTAAVRVALDQRLV